MEMDMGTLSSLDWSNFVGRDYCSFFRYYEKRIKMKEFGIGFLLVIWCLITAGLAISVIGLLILLSNWETGEKSTWMTIGTALVSKL
jgi:hypothetical protein